MATNYDLNITRGTRYYIRLAAVNDDAVAINLSGYSISGQVRHRYGSSGKLLDIPASGVVGFYDSGYIDVDIPASLTTGLPIVQGVYDLELHSGSYQDKIIYGYFNVNPEVTH